MTALPLRQTIEYVYKVVPGSASRLRPRGEIGSLQPGMVGKRFGLWEVMSRKIIRDGKQIKLRCRCTGCGLRKEVNSDSLRRGTSTGCQACGNRITSPELGPLVKRLGRRYDAIVARCMKPHSKAYARYGGRGIQNRFGSHREFILWVLENLPHKDYIGAEIDRRDNDGHYEPGNLRLATRHEQCNNKANTRYYTYRRKIRIPVSDAYHVIRTIDPKVVYSVQTMSNLHSQGLRTIEAIIKRFYQPSDKPKGRTILPTPDRAIASQYLGS